MSTPAAAPPSGLAPGPLPAPPLWWPEPGTPVGAEPTGHQAAAVPGASVPVGAQAPHVPEPAEPPVSLGKTPVLPYLQPEPASPTPEPVPEPPPAPLPAAAPAPEPVPLPEPELAPVFVAPGPLPEESEPPGYAPDPAPAHPMFHAAVAPVAAGTGAEGAPYEPPRADEPDFGWEFEPQDPGQFRWENPKPTGLRKWWLPLTVGVFAVLMLGLVAAYVLVGGNDKPAAGPTGPSLGPAASEIDPVHVAEYQPRHVAAALFEGRIQVTWESPEKDADVVGYLVAAQTRDGKLLDSQLIRTKELIAVFGGESANPGTCVVVTTLVRGTPGMQLAKSSALCPGDSPAPTNPGGASTPPGGAPAGQAPSTPAGAPEAPGIPGDEGNPNDQMNG